MSVFAISDLHLSIDKPSKAMDVFGARWSDYTRKIEKNWIKMIGDNDTVIIPGDISWGLSLDDAIEDLKFIDSLPGKKIIMKGNHDFWWSTVSKLEKAFKENNITTFEILNNNAIEVENYILAGSRGWFTDKTMQNVTQGEVNYDKIINREVIRLRLSLEAAKKLQAESGKEILVFFHFPPIWSEFR